MRRWDNSWPDSYSEAKWNKILIQYIYFSYASFWKDEQQKKLQDDYTDWDFFVYAHIVYSISKNSFETPQPKQKKKEQTPE